MAQEQVGECAWTPAFHCWSGYVSFISAFLKLELLHVEIIY